MKRALAIVNYILNVTKAVAKGLETTIDMWPVDNPFTGNHNEGVHKKPDESAKQANSMADIVS